MMKIRTRTTPASKASNDTSHQDTSKRLYISVHRPTNKINEFSNCQLALRFDGVSNAFACCRSSDEAFKCSYDIVGITDINEFLAQSKLNFVPAPTTPASRQHKQQPLC
jgi:hypothetical protein